eukprot:CAMPEP_0180525550 /NCGR_PEP_ID=MMETSP1036_2-20121128/59223_1 /TAXON_ID=632150 /ORGANISM="Azadinium spinosum, Strain 3D9" /LENGTH=73 /DNA_ID=CAMNT_0022538847 /DNA_START=23 /DNA_END=240 /DNA_ORIENTATION=-
MKMAPGVTMTENGRSRAGPHIVGAQNPMSSRKDWERIHKVKVTDTEKLAPSAASAPHRLPPRAEELLEKAYLR